MAIPETMIEAFLTFWYPGEWPDNLGLPGGRMADEAFKVKARKECREGLEAAGVAELLTTGQELIAASDAYDESLESEVRCLEALSAFRDALVKAIGSPSDDARAAHRAAVEAGYADLAGYVETYGKDGAR